MSCRYNLNRILKWIVQYVWDRWNTLANVLIHLMRIRTWWAELHMRSVVGCESDDGQACIRLDLSRNQETITASGNKTGRGRVFTTVRSDSEYASIRILTTAYGLHVVDEYQSHGDSESFDWYFPHLLDDDYQSAENNYNPFELSYLQSFRLTSVARIFVFYKRTYFGISTLWIIIDEHLVPNANGIVGISSVPIFSSKNTRCAMPKKITFGFAST